MRDISTIAKRVGKTVKDNSPAILSATAVAGVVTTAILTGKGALRADVLLREIEGEKDLLWAPTPRERVELTWKCYIPAVLVGSSTILCIVAANQIGSRRSAALMSAATLSETAFREYKDKVVEQIGAKKEQTVRDSIAEDRIQQSSEVVIIADGETPCYDMYSGRFLKCDMESLRKAANDINADINSNMYASLTDFYNLIGLEPTDVSDQVGWNMDNRLELEFTSVLKGGKAYLAFGYAKNPKADFHKVW